MIQYDLGLGVGMALWCTIRTFAKHAAELGNEQPPEPVFFVKPHNCITSASPLDISGHPGQAHHEVECIIRLNSDLGVESVAVGLDLTDRQAQSQLRSEQLPWAKGKCFRGSAVVGPFSDWDGDFESLVCKESGLRLRLTVNGEIVQEADLNEMTITPKMQIEALKEWAPVCSGDYLFTGTPAGVGQLHAGDEIEAVLETLDGRAVSRFCARCE